MLIDGDTYRKETEKMINKAIKKVSKDIEDMKFNTCVSTFMTMMNEFTKLKTINKAEFKTFITLLNPFAPHMTEELNEIVFEDEPISSCKWPIYDESKTIDEQIEIPIQVNGKLKATVMIDLDEDEASVKEKVHTAIQDKIDGKNIKKEIYVKNKIYNVVI